jgi:hypothetical protein
MSDTAALIVDHEGLTGSLQRARIRRPDMLRLIRYLEGFRPGRTLLWAKWIVPARLEGDLTWRYYDFLRANGIRLEVVEPKPITRLENRREPNACDFAVIEAIYLAAQKVDTVILAASDGHFARAIAAAHHQAGCRVEIVCDRQGLSSLIVADHFHFLEDIAQNYGLDRRDEPAYGLVTPPRLHVVSSSRQAE